MASITPLNGYVVLKPVDTEEEMYGNIVIPDLGKERPEVGKVMAVSETYNYHSDREIPSKLKVGDEVLIPKLGSVRVVVHGEELFICKEQDVFGKL